MGALEGRAAEAGATSAWLQVLARNEPARRLYRRLGYTEAWASPAWQGYLSWPSYLMRKDLTRPS